MSPGTTQSITYSLTLCHGRSESLPVPMFLCLLFDDKSITVIGKKKNRIHCIVLVVVKQCKWGIPDLFMERNKLQRP